MATGFTSDPVCTLTQLSADELPSNPAGFEASTINEQQVETALLVSLPASVTPEPSSIALLGTGMLGIAGVMRKRFADA